MKKIGYPIRAVAKMTGLSPDTLRAWERRYGAVNPARGARGRIYQDSHVRRLTLLRELVELGHSIGQIADRPDSRLKELLAGSNRHAAPETGTSHDKPAVSPAIDPILRAVESFDATKLNFELGRMAAVNSVRNLVHDVVHPLMLKVGEGWSQGRYSIAQEHLVSASLRNLLGSLIRLHVPDDPAATILLCTPSGELHEFGILAAALLAVGGSLRVVYLGPNLPADEIVRSVRMVAPEAVLLGLAADNPEAEKEILKLLRSMPPGVEVWVGGNGRLLDGNAQSKRSWIRLNDFAELERHLLRLGARL